MSENAIQPGADAIFASYTALKEKPVIKQKVTQKEKLARLADYEGWKEMEAVIQGHIDGLKNLPINPETDTVESIGFRYLASDIAIGYLQDILEQPQRAKAIQAKKENK